MENEAVCPRTGLDAVIGLGANLGDPAVALRRAVTDLAQVGHLGRVSQLYRTLPVGGPPQPDFLNAAVRLTYDGSALALLSELHRLERLAGRERRERWGPRTLDLDILWFAGVGVDRPGLLVVPHPRLRERPFALLPLLDVAPDAVDPGDGVRYAELSAARSLLGVERLDGEWSEAVAGQISRGIDRPCS